MCAHVKKGKGESRGFTKTNSKLERSEVRKNLKEVKHGKVRLERHSGSGLTGVAKKRGAGGKGTWGKPSADLYDLYDLPEKEEDEEEEEEAEEAVEDTTESKAAPLASSWGKDQSILMCEDAKMEDATASGQAAAARDEQSLQQTADLQQMEEQTQAHQRAFQAEVKELMRNIEAPIVNYKPKHKPEPASKNAQRYNLRNPRQRPNFQFKQPGPTACNQRASGY